MRERDVGIRELARQADISPAAVSRILSGKSGGHPWTRRAIRSALLDFPVISPDQAQQEMRVMRNPMREARELGRVPVDRKPKPKPASTMPVDRNPAKPLRVRRRYEP